MKKIFLFFIAILCSSIAYSQKRRMEIIYDANGNIIEKRLVVIPPKTESRMGIDSSLLLIEKIKTFPNPIQDVLNVEVIDYKNESEIVVQIISQENNSVVISTTQNNAKFQINVSHLNTGAYFLILIYDNKREQKQIFKS